MNLSKDKTLDLVSRCGDGEEDALRQFFEIYSEDIYNFPMKIFHLSEDDAGDFFIYAFERLKTAPVLEVLRENPVLELGSIPFLEIC